MKNKGAIAILRNISLWNIINGDEYNALKMAIKALEREQDIKTLGEEMRIMQKGITDEKVLLGFNMAIALCNKHIGKGANE